MGAVEAWHDQDVGGAGEAAEGVEGAVAGVERHVGGHFAVVFEVGLAGVEDGHCIAHGVGDVGVLVAEGGVAEQGDARFVAEAAGGGGGAGGDVGDFGGGWAEVHEGVGDEDGVAAVADHEGEAEGDFVGGGVDDVGDVGEADGG